MDLKPSWLDRERRKNILLYIYLLFRILQPWSNGRTSTSKWHDDTLCPLLDAHNSSPPDWMSQSLSRWTLRPQAVRLAYINSTFPFTLFVLFLFSFIISFSFSFFWASLSSIHQKEECNRCRELIGARNSNRFGQLQQHRK